MKKLSTTGPKEKERGSESDTRKRRIVELQYIVRIEKKPTPARLNQKTKDAFLLKSF